MDDTVIFATSHDRMQQKLDALSSYCSQFGMIVNQAKTKYIAVNPTSANLQLHIGDLQIQQTESYTYLGSPILNAPISTQIQAHVQSKMNSRRKFSSFLSRNDNAPFFVKRKVWDAALNSAIVYSCESWMSANIKGAEKIYAATMKEMLSVRVQTPIDICTVCWRLVCHP